MITKPYSSEVSVIIVLIEFVLVNGESFVDGITNVAL